MPKTITLAAHRNTVRQMVGDLRRVLRDLRKQHRWHVRQWDKAKAAGNAEDVRLHRACCANLCAPMDDIGRIIANARPHAEARSADSVQSDVGRGN